jgi:hypothetical protein
MDAVLTDMLLTAEGTATDAEPAVVDAALTAAAATVAPLAEEAGVRVRVGQGDDAGRCAFPASPSTGSASRSWTCSAHSRRRGRTVGAIRRTGVAIRVRDGGTGIADADRERIFERFARGPESGRRRGFGLGLALVRGQPGGRGRIEIERTSAAGTTACWCCRRLRSGLGPRAPSRVQAAVAATVSTPTPATHRRTPASVTVIAECSGAIPQPPGVLAGGDGEGGRSAVVVVRDDRRAHRSRHRHA